MKLCSNVFGLDREITALGIRPGNDDEESLNQGSFGRDK